MTDPERIAAELRKIRKCEAGGVPCPFCSWDNNETTEMGCVWMAERLLASGVVRAVKLIWITDPADGVLRQATSDPQGGCTELLAD